MKTFNYIFLLLSLLVFFTACKKMIEVPTPANQLTTDKVFADSVAANAAIGNVYLIFQTDIDPLLTRYLGLYTDELTITNHSTGDDEFLNGRISPGNGIIGNLWSSLYQAVYQCNAIMEEAGKSTNLASSFRNRLINESRFLRAYAYLTLVNCFGSVPLVLQTNVNTNMTLGQSDAAAVYQQIIADLTEAKQGLPDTYAGSGKVRANKWAAAALLARVYLYRQNWASAEAEATAVINTGKYGPLADPGAVFQAGSQETILQCWTQYGFTNLATFLLPSAGTPTQPMTDSLYNAFETGDKRKAGWTGFTSVPSGAGNTVYYYAYKYHNPGSNTTKPEYLMILRLSEQYLIRAEARTMQNNFTGAGDDLNAIRTRAALPNATANDQPGLIKGILGERRVELFTEWGHRFFDLKRTGQLNAAIGSGKTGWSAASLLLPIPQSELNSDAQLRQNPGY